VLGRRRRTSAKWVYAGSALVALVLSACGGGSSSVGGSSASFDISGYKVSETVSKGSSISERFSGSPQLNYSGPEGCEGQAFVASGDQPVFDILFRYSSADAYLVFGRTVYHFVMGPQQSRGKLVWDETFGGDHVVATVDCPPPRTTGPLLPPSY
jgi:hypothetical protein